MPKQLGPLPGSEFPDKSLQIALQGFLATLEKHQEELRDVSNISERSINTIEGDLRELYEFLESSRSAQAILPYRISLLESLQKAMTELYMSEVIMKDSKSFHKQAESVFYLVRTREILKSIQNTLRTGLSKPLYSKTPYRRS